MNDHLEQWDQATARRLRRLDAMPVDTSRLDQGLAGQIPPTRNRACRFWPASFQLRPLRAAAASVLVALVLAGIVLMSTLTGPVQASAIHMAKLHDDLVAGRVPVTQVDSIEAAAKTLLAQWPQAPDLPDVPQEHVMACCTNSVKNRKMACVLLKKEGVPITMAIANAEDVTGRHGTKIQRAGVTYYLQAVGTLNMLAGERDGRWVCLMGQLPVEQLIELAEGLQF